MKKRIISRRAVGFGLLPLAAAVAFVLASTSNAARMDPPGAAAPQFTLPPRTITLPLLGHFRNIVQHFGCADSSVFVCSTFTADGAITGSGYVVVDTFPASDPAALGFSEAHTVIHTPRGDLKCREAALFDVAINADHPFVDLCLINADPNNQSTGDYAGASGYIQEVGTFPGPLGAPGTVGSVDYYGKITMPLFH